MGANYLIDSNVIIGYLDNKLPANGMTMLNSIIDDIPNVSVISKIEVLRFRGSPGVSKILEDFFNQSNVLALTDTVVDKTIAICKTHKIKLPDAVIAATAVVFNFTLLTRNIGDFKNIQDLAVLNPWDLKL